MKYDVFPFDADAEVAAAKRKWTAEKDMSSIYITIPAVVLLPEYGTAFQTASKSPIAEEMESVKLPPMSVAEVVEQWVRGINSAEA